VVKSPTVSQSFSIICILGSIIALKWGAHFTYALITFITICVATCIILLALLSLLLNVKVRFVIFLAPLLMLSFSYASFFMVPFPYPYGKPVRVELRILSEPRVRGQSLQYMARLKGTAVLFPAPTTQETPESTLELLHQKVLLQLPVMSGYPQRGDRVRVRGLFSELPEYERYLKHRGFHALFEGSSRDFTVLRRPATLSVMGLTNRLRDYVRRVNDRLLLWPQGEFATSLLTGSREHLPRELLDSFRLSGTMHILAVSGLHIGFLVLFFLLLCKLVRIGETATHLVLVGVVIFFMIFIGEAPSVKRASIMVLCGIFVFLMDRDRDFLNVLSIAFNILWITNPLTLFDPGFLLSFTATFAILFLVPHTKRIFEKALPSFIAVPLALSVGVQVYLLPVMLSFFGIFSYITVFANLPIVPLAGLALALEILTLLFYPLALPAAVLLSEVNILVISTIIRLARFFARVPPLAVSRFPGELIVLYFVGLTAVLWLLLEGRNLWLRRSINIVHSEE
jgi:ComEC/Rec2-related protein